jgi:hypothetical protein
MKPSEQNELVSVMRASANICPAIRPVARSLGVGPFWQKVDKNVRDEQFAFLAQLVTNTRTDDEAMMLRRARLAVEWAAKVLMTLTLRHVASAMKHSVYTICSDPLYKQAAAIEQLFSPGVSRVDDGRIIDVVWQAAHSTSIPYDLFPRTGSSIGRAVVENHGVAWATAEAVRTIIGPVLGTSDTCSRVMGAGVDVGNASITAVRAICNAGIATIEAIDGKNGEIIKAIDVRRAITRSKDLVRDEMITLVRDMCLAGSGMYEKPCSQRRSELCYGAGS